MRDFADEVQSEYRTWIFLEWTATIGRGRVPAGRDVPVLRLGVPAAASADRRLAADRPAGRFRPSHPPAIRSDEMAELADAHERHDRPLPGNSRRPRRAGAAAHAAKSSAASSSPASASWPPAWRTRSTTRWPRSPGARIARSRGCTTLLGERRPPAKRSRRRAKSSATTCR